MPPSQTSSISSSGLGAERLARAWPALLMAAAALLYGSTLCPTIYWDDSAELTVAAKTLGIPHPPGYPLYTLLGWVFTQLPTNAGHAMNIMSAVFSTLAVGLSYAVSRELGAGRCSSGASTVLLASGAVFWKHSTIAEVYTPGLAFLLAALWLALLGVRQRRVMPTWVAGLIAGLGLGVHLSIATTGLTFVGLALLNHPRGIEREGKPWEKLLQLAKRQWRNLLAAGLCAGLGSCIFFYLPLRARMRPSMNFGNPENLDSLWWVASGGVFREWFGVDEGFWERLQRILNILNDELTIGGIALSMVGLWRLAALRGRAMAAFWGLGALGNLVYFFDYRVFDLEVFFLPASVMLASVAALGLDQCSAWLTRNNNNGHLDTLLMIATAGALSTRIAVDYPKRDVSHETGAYDYGAKLVAELPRSSIIVTYMDPQEWRYFTVFRWYFQGVLGKRPDVPVLDSAKPEVVRKLVADGFDVFAFSNVKELNGFELLQADGVDDGLLKLALPTSARE